MPWQTLTCLVAISASFFDSLCPRGYTASRDCGRKADGSFIRPVESVMIDPFYWLCLSVHLSALHLTQCSGPYSAALLMHRRC
ncbi:hypothetical protein DFH06DRAFT_1163449 [Mycena polygramma]|nr:hypothetical protein DFH06DRAFT_1163449 [Mycena polygramma]